MNEDPAAPEGFDATDKDSVAAVEATNFGADVAETESAAPTHPAGTPATLTIDPVAALAFLQACMNSQPRVSYGLGTKVPFHGAIPGRDFTKVDCSGFVRELVFRATTPPFDFPDGSVVQHDWVAQQGFAKSSIADGKLHDGAVRIAFLAPQASPSHIGHVVILHEGSTLESHGGLGPDSRPWTGDDWQGKTTVFVLTPP
jgi:hypothetical protein